MPSGRNAIAYDGIRYDGIPAFVDGVTILYDVTKAGGSAQVGLAVTLSADDTIALAADGDAIYGKLILVEPDGAATVQRWGMASLPAGNAAAINRGNRIVGALGAAAARGYIRDAAAATAAELVKARGTVVNKADLAKVWVDLG